MAATRLRAQALRAVDEITAAAGDEYREYVAARAVMERGRQSRTAGEHGRPSTTTVERGQQSGTAVEHGRQPQPAAPGALLPALAALTPPIAGTAAAVLLVLGYSLRLADAQGAMGGSLVTAGWVFALIAVASTLAGLTALLCTALRARPGHGDRTRASARTCTMPVRGGSGRCWSAACCPTSVGSSPPPASTDAPHRAIRHCAAHLRTTPSP